MAYIEEPTDASTIRAITSDITAHLLNKPQNISSALMEKIVQRKQQMYYLARTNPHMFLQNILPNDVLSDPRLALLAEQKVKLISILMYDPSTHAYTIHLHMMGIPLYVFNTNSAYVEGLKNKNVELEGYKLEDRFVLLAPTHRFIKEVQEKYGAH